MEHQVAIIEREIANVENILLNKASIVQNMDQFFEFYFSYLSNYIPMLEFAIESLPENSIAKLGNFGMLIDHVTSIQLDRVISIQNIATANQISKKIQKPKSQILSALNNMTDAHKIQLSSQLLLASSLTRDLNLAGGTSKFSAINKIIAWSNILSNFLHYPALIEIMIKKELLEIAEKELIECKTLIQKRDRSYDWGLASEWHDSVQLSRLNIQEIPKFFIGPKLAWLQAMEALELGKCILNKSKESGNKALIFNKKILSILKNKNLSTNEWSYRSFNSGGPSCNIDSIIEENNTGKIKAVIVDSHTILFQSRNNRFFLTVPSNFNFYINPNWKVALHENLEIPLSHDLNAIISFYKNPALFVINNLGKISDPGDSYFLMNKMKDRDKIKSLLESMDSIPTKLAVTYNTEIYKPIAKIVQKTCITTMDGVIVYGLLTGFEGLAKAKGFDISVELWSEIRLAITAIIINKVNIVTEFMKKSVDEENRQEATDENEQDKPLYSFDDKMRTFYEKIEDSNREFTDAIREAKDQGLIDILDIANEIREIILSGLSMEEIKEKLDNYSKIIRDEETIFEN